MTFMIEVEAHKEIQPKPSEFMSFIPIVRVCMTLLLFRNKRFMLDEMTWRNASKLN